MFNDIKILHLETTTVCNAACPQCAREDSNLYNDSTHRSTLTVNKFKELFDKKFILNLDKVFACGDYGDPAATNNTIKIFEYVRSVKPSITLGMNTNGSIQNLSWWNHLGHLLSNTYDYCVFSIDGLDDTNHLYRIGTKFSKILENAQSFIDAGGNAHWDMLVFAHNEHQIETCKQLAKDMGFSHFRSKVSKRFLTKPVVGLEPPSSLKLPNINEPTKVDCAVLKDQSLYVSASGEIFPCCWLGIHAYNRDSKIDSLLANSFNKLVKSFTSDPHPICVKTCGVKDLTSSFENQWTEEVTFK